MSVNWLYPHFPVFAEFEVIQNEKEESLFTILLNRKHFHNSTLIFRSDTTKT